MRVLILLSIASICTPVLAGSPVTITHSYRHVLFLRSQDYRYTGEISGADLNVGPRYDVETDSRGRILSVRSYEYGTLTGTTTYSYKSKGSRYAREDYFSNGELTGSDIIGRDSQGNRIKERDVTPTGELTDYWDSSYFDDHVHSVEYKKTGEVLVADDHYFTTDGVRIRTVMDLGSGTKGENIYNHETGQRTAQNRYDNGKLSYHRTYTYDDNDELVRSDNYGPGGDWYGGDEYSNGLLVKRVADIAEGKKESEISYDSKRALKDATFSVNGTLVCTFRYDVYPNGAVERTLALGPTGEVYAEYPDHAVYDVNRDGSPVIPMTGVVIHKQGNWW